MQPRSWCAVICLAVLVAACGDSDDGDGGSGRPTGGGDEVEASASFEITLGEESARLDLSQSEIVPSHLDFTPQVPVNLHAGEAEAFGDEFTLSGRVKEGEQKTSDAVVVGLNAELETSSALFVSDDGTCTVTVDELTDSRIEGSFTCDAEYGSQPLTAEGTFEAS